jgi:hypothetical protein
MVGVTAINATCAQAAQKARQAMTPARLNQPDGDCEPCFTCDLFRSRETVSFATAPGLGDTVPAPLFEILLGVKKAQTLF